jgi:hypothetical protein
MSRRFKTPVVLESGLLLPVGLPQAGDILAAQDSSGAAVWKAPSVVLPPYASRCYIGGQTAAYVGGAVWVTASGQSPAGIGYPVPNFSGVTWTVPNDGTYRMVLWVRLDNASAGKSGGIRANKNGTAFDTAGTARVYNGTAAMYAAAAGFLVAGLNSGDTIKPEVWHDDTAARTVSWRMSIEQMLGV